MMVRWRLRGGAGLRWGSSASPCWRFSWASSVPTCTSTSSKGPRPPGSSCRVRPYRQHPLRRRDPDTTSSSLEGTWNVGSNSTAGYRVQEVLIGQSATAVGRTDKIWGSLTVAGSTVTKGTFTVNMASVVSDQSQRNARFAGPIMDVNRYPTTTLTLTSPISLGTIPVAGAVTRYDAVGDLDMHGVTKSVSFPVSAERVGTEIYVLADISIPFSEWDIANPSIGGFVTTANTGTLEVLLHLTQGPGNPVSTSSSSGSSGPVGGGGGGPVTVPSTTVPPLTVPSS